MLPPGLPQVPVGLATADRLTNTSPNPSPASSPDAVSFRPLSVNAGFEWSPFRCTLEANAGVVSTVARANRTTIAHTLLIFFSPLTLGIFLIAPVLGARDNAWKNKVTQFVNTRSRVNVDKTRANDCMKNKDSARKCMTSLVRSERAFARQSIGHKLTTRSLSQPCPTPFSRLRAAGSLKHRASCKKVDRG